MKASSPGGSLEEGTLLRLIMPALPALVILTATIPLLIPTVGPKIAERFPVRTIALQWRSRVVVGAAVVLGLVPVVVLGALKPLQDGRAATLSSASVYVPAQHDFGLSAGVFGTFVTLRWNDETSDSARSFYTLYISPAKFKIPKGSPDEFPTVTDGLLCQRQSGSASQCSIEMQRLVTTRGLEYVDNRPPGTWTYRIGVAANWRDDDQFGDTMLLSAPVTVTVR
jgi:hypothetical protein